MFRLEDRLKIMTYYSQVLCRRGLDILDRNNGKLCKKTPTVTINMGELMAYFCDQQVKVGKHLFALV